MRRRILLFSIAAVTIALALSGVATYILLRSDTRAAAARSLVSRAQSIADGRRLQGTQPLEVTREVLELRTAGVYGLPRPTETFDPTDTFVAVGDPLDPAISDRIGPAAVRRLRAGGKVSGIAGDLTFAAVPNQARPDSVVILTKQLESDLVRVVRWYGIGAVVALVVASLGAAGIARRLTRPLRDAETTTRQIAAGDLTVRVPVPASGPGSDDEIGDLARSINRMAVELDRSRGLERQFLMSVSHDLRTPLTSIRGFADAIAEGTAPDQQRAAAVIASESRRLERLVRDLLELAKLDSRRFTLDMRRTDITELVTDAADGFLPAAEREHLNLTLEAAPSLVADTDPERLSQVLANLIENALKFARTSVHVALEPDGPEVRIVVTDDGPGIDEADLPHIFERLYASDRRPARQIGSGLGLAIVHELVTALGGTVEADTSGAGTSFVLSLKAAGPP